LVVDGDGTIEADEDRLKRLFENLFRNSVEHGTPVDNTTDDGAEESEITITVGQLVDNSGFYIEDDGVGVPEADRESMFEAGNTGSGSGSGLGLAIVRRIAQAHGWEVDLREAETGGARFEFRT